MAQRQRRNIVIKRPHATAVSHGTAHECTMHALAASWQALTGAHFAAERGSA